MMSSNDLESNRNQNGTVQLQQYPPKNRPIPVAIIGFLNKEFSNDFKLNLDALCINANKHQGLFSFVTLKDNNISLGLYDEKHCYSEEKCFNVVRDAIHGTGYEYGIGITHHPIHDNSFNIHDRKNYGVGMVTLDDAEEHQPASYL